MRLMVLSQQEQKHADCVNKRLITTDRMRAGGVALNSPWEDVKPIGCDLEDGTVSIHNFDHLRIAQAVCHNDASCPDNELKESWEHEAWSEDSDGKKPRRTRLCLRQSQATTMEAQNKKPRNSKESHGHPKPVKQSAIRRHPLACRTETSALLDGTSVFQ